MDTILTDLYQELIIDHGTEPRNFYKLDPWSHTASGYNPLCGDKLELFLDIDNNIINKISFLGEGCAISMASASLLTEIIKNKNINQAEHIFNNIINNLTQNQYNDLPGKLQALMGVKNYPMRIKCATLAWHALKDALPKVNQENNKKLSLNITRMSDNPWQVEFINNSNNINLNHKITKCLKNIFDPELPVNIYDLGLIHKVEIDKDFGVLLTMTLTTPACPVAQSFPESIKQEIIKNISEINQVDVILTWEPAWNNNRLSVAVKLQLGLM